MTWGEFKKAVEAQDVEDFHEIQSIDIDHFDPSKVEVFQDEDGNLIILAYAGVTTPLREIVDPEPTS